MSADVTLVTALLDIGRGEMATSFARPFPAYLDALAQLLRVELPMVVYVDPSHLSFVRDLRAGLATRVIPLRAEELRGFPHDDHVQRIRSREAWLAQAPWLPDSPQARLAGYNPLVMSKLTWLATQAEENPFGTNHFVWVDGGIASTVDPRVYMRGAFSARLLPRLTRFLLIAFPYTGGGEIHGFNREAIAGYANTTAVTWVARGGFFGGRRDYVFVARRLYDALLEDTLARGYMGTEESLLTILAHLHPHLFHRYMVGEDGLIYPFFAELLRADVAQGASPAS